jgi:DnaJ-class molecular chaperone
MAVDFNRTNNGKKLRLRGRGLPKGQNGERGDLYVVVNVQFADAGK